MTLSMRSEPDCTGKCSLFTIVSFSPIKRSVRSSMLDGWLVVNHTRGATSATLSRRSQNRFPSCRQASTVCPSNVTYPVPLCTRPSISATTFSSGRHTMRPLTEGTMQ
jgi:hypothetical protein